MAHVPNGPAIFYRDGEEIYVESGEQPEGWSDRPEESEPGEKPRRARKSKPEAETLEAGE
jgi:hypothetical protein